MRWEDERYVKLYTRDTVEWLARSFEAQALIPLVMRKLNRSGQLKLGRFGLKAVAISIGHASRFEELKPGLEELLADGTFVIEGTPEEGQTLTMPEFVAAQEAISSGARRTRTWRERKRDAGGGGGGHVPGLSDEASPPRDKPSPSGDGACHGVTGCDPIHPSHPSEPSDPSHPNHPIRAGAREDERPERVGAPNGAGLPPTAVAQVCAAVSQRLRRNGAGLPLPSNKKLSEFVQATTTAVARHGFDHVVETIATAGQAMAAKGEPAETMGAFANLMRELATDGNGVAPTGKSYWER